MASAKCTMLPNPSQSRICIQIDLARNFLYFFCQNRKIVECVNQSSVVRNGKKSPEQKTGLGNRGRLTVLNDTKLVLNGMSDPLIIQDQFGIIQNLQASPIPQTRFLLWTFFAVSYSKTALNELWHFLCKKAAKYKNYANSQKFCSHCVVIQTETLPLINRFSGYKFCFFAK